MLVRLLLLDSSGRLGTSWLNERKMGHTAGWTKLQYASLNIDTKGYTESDKSNKLFLLNEHYIAVHM